MINRPSHIALLLAGGQGARMHCDRPKQFMDAEGQPVILYTLQTFQAHPDIDDIYVVASPEWKDFVERTAQRGGIGKLRQTLSAGTTSIDSLRNGLKGISEHAKGTNPVVLIHEAVRPLVSAEIITRNLETFHTCGNAITAIRSNEAYMVSNDGQQSASGLPRERLYRAQTPQTFSLRELTDTFARAERLGLTNSQSLYTLMREVYPEKTLYIAPGNELNFKLTVPEDIDTLRALLAWRRQK